MALTGIALCALLCLSSSLLEAQQPKKLHRVDFIGAASAATVGHYLESFRQGTRELGYVEGGNLAIEVRWADGTADRFPRLIAELSALKIDVLVVGGAAGAVAAKKAAIKTPVVFATVTDPLGYGLIESLARPGGNLTGTALSLGEGFSGKWVELLKESIPKAAKMNVLRHPEHPLAETFLRETQAAGRAHGVKLEYFEARDAIELGDALSRVEKQRAGAFIVTPSPLFSTQLSRIVNFALQQRLPSMFYTKEFADGGGLISYGPSFSESYRRTATYIDKILKGAKPAELPVEQPLKFEFVINLNTAKQIGVTIPQSVLFRADKVIK